MPDRIPVVYILSNGRSGTTLLDLLLGSAPSAWTVGEAQLLPWELREDRHPCGCGKPVRDCPFWRSVLPRIPLGGSPHPIEHFRESHGAGRVLRWKLLPDLVRGRTSARWSDAVAQYGRLNAEYLGAVRRAARRESRRAIEWLIDASMDPYRLLWLKASGRFELRVVHLTKSPPAFVFSMVKPYLPEGLGTSLRMAGRWLIENSLMRRLCEKAFTAEEVRHLRYEDLAGNTSAVRLQLSEWLGLPLPQWTGKAFREHENHAIAGNKMRWEDTEIRLDERWKEDLPATHRNLTRLITAPLSRSLGY